MKKTINSQEVNNNNTSSNSHKRNTGNKNMQGGSSSNKSIANEDIPKGQVFVITNDGRNLGAMDRDEAIDLAYSENLDLLVVGEREGKPVTKILNLNKELYERKKKEKIAKKNQQEIEIKELRITPRIGAHDLEIKVKKALSVLSDGDRVKFVLFLKGREKSVKDPGVELFQKITDMIVTGTASSNKQLVMEQGLEKGMRLSKIFFLKK